MSTMIFSKAKHEGIQIANVNVYINFYHIVQTELKEYDIKIYLKEAIYVN